MNFGSGGGDGGSSSAGPELQDVQTEQLAFQAVVPDGTLRLIPSPWPSGNLPPTTASLLSVASSKGLVAAAGSDVLVVARTASVRKSMIEGQAGENGVKDFQPEATISIPRVSQVRFSSDESCLVIVAEQGGGLAVYDTNAIVNGGKEPAFQLSTNGQSVKHLIPNPNPSSDLSRYFAIVTEQGQLLLADLKDQKLVNTASGSPVFHEDVYCACWSRLGKQIIAGLSTGSSVQIDPQGAVKATIPEPPQTANWKSSSGDTHYPVSSIYWIDTNEFLLVYTPVKQPGSMAEDDSLYILAQREKAASKDWTFGQLPDPCPAFGAERKPAHHFMERLREWSPDLSDMLILASTASSDPGTFTKSKAPLDPERPITDTWTLTMPPDDGRLSMPMSVDMGGDTSPIGMALDLGSTEKAPRPIPTDETMDQSPVELPVLYILSNEGRLSAWYIVYRPSLRHGVLYPDLIAAGGPRSLGEQKQQQTPAPALQSAPAAAPATSTFGSSAAPTFGSASTPSAFGGTSMLGNRSSPWGTPSATATGGSTFGKPSFGAPSMPGGGGVSAFGSASALGSNRASPWGAQTPSSPQAANTSANTGTGTGSGVFGGSMGQQSGFGSFAAASKPAASPFAAFGSGGASGDKPSPSPFAAAAGSGGMSSFASAAGTANSASPFASAGMGNNNNQSSAFGTGSSFGSAPFGVASNNKTSNFGQPSTGGSSFGQPSTTSHEEAMDDEEDEKPITQTQGTGAFGMSNSGFQLGSTFKGDGSAKDDLPKPKDAGAGLFGPGFGSALGDVDKKATEQPIDELGKTKDSGAGLFGSSFGKTLGGEADRKSADQPTTPIKDEPESPDASSKLQDIPPASTTPAAPPPKAEKQAPIDDAPLPPDPSTWKPKPGALPPPIPPGFGADFGKPATKTTEEKGDAASKEPEAAPLPPSFTWSTADKKEEAEHPVAGPPSVDLAGSRLPEGQDSEEAGPVDDDDEEVEWSDEEIDGEEEEDEEAEDEDDYEGEEEEGEEEDEGEDEATQEVTDQKGLEAFKARLTPGSPKREEQQADSTTPETGKKSSYTPAGLPKAPVMFPPPVRPVNDSPRSPSPVRSATSPLHFGKASQQPAPKINLSSNNPKTQPPQRIAVPAAQLVQKEQSVLPPPVPKEPVSGDLHDEEDDHVQKVLAAPIEPTRELPSFLAHQDYVGGTGRITDRMGVGGQIERVYRDINSMIDTFALNARSMESFVQGHRADDGKQRELEDLEDEEGWGFGEVNVVSRLVDWVDSELKNGRIDDVKYRMDNLRKEESEMVRIKARGADVRKQILARTNPTQKALHAAAGLPMEAQTQQAELRQSVQKVQAQLAKAEELLSVLRAELASAAQTNGASHSSPGAVPTVEAVTNTILKMTAMIEKKSSDIDLLEAQIRRLGGAAALRASTSGGASGTYEDDLAASMRASRISHGSPLASRSSAAAAARRSVYGTGFTELGPSTSPLAARKNSSPGQSLRSSRIGADGLRRSLFDVSDAEINSYVRRKERRREVCAALREQVEARGVKVVTV